MDQDLEGLSVQGLKDLLDQVVDHRKPESEKSVLARRLNEEACKDEASLESHFSSRTPFLSGTVSAPNNSNVNQRKEFGRKSSRNKGPEYVSGGLSGRQQQVHSSQSLQDLAQCNETISETGLRSVAMSSTSSKAGSGGRRRATRANSFSLQQDSSELSQLTNERSASAAATGSWPNSAGSVQQQRNKQQLTSTKSKTTAATAAATASHISSSCSSSRKASPPPMLTCSLNASANHNDSNNNKSACDEGADNLSTTLCDDSSCSSSHSSRVVGVDSSVVRVPTNSLQLQNKSSRNDSDSDEIEGHIELQDMSKRPNYQRYTSANGPRPLEGNESPNESTCLLQKSNSYFNPTVSDVDTVVQFNELFNNTNGQYNERAIDIGNEPENSSLMLPDDRK